MITWTNLNQVIYHNILWLIGHETNKVEYRKDAIKRVQT